MENLFKYSSNHDAIPESYIFTDSIPHKEKKELLEITKEYKELYGINAQFSIAMEECAELIVELIAGDDVGQVIEELNDVDIMSASMIYNLDLEVIDPAFFAVEKYDIKVVLANMIKYYSKMMRYSDPKWKEMLSIEISKFYRFKAVTLLTLDPTNEDSVDYIRRKLSRERLFSSKNNDKLVAKESKIREYCKRFTQGQAEHAREAEDNYHYLKENNYGYMCGCPTAFGLTDDEFTGSCYIIPEDQQNIETCDDCWERADKIK